MARRAKILTDAQFNSLLQDVGSNSLDALRDYAILMFSFKAGLRAAEIAGISWNDVTDAAGEVGDPREVDGEIEHFFTVPRRIAKKGHERELPMHPALRATLQALQKRDADAKGVARGNVIKGRFCERVNANALQRYLSRLYKSYGLSATSHSGRRTFITKAARAANSQDCSLMDVQRLAGHRYIDTTEAYVDFSPNVGKLVRSL